MKDYKAMMDEGRRDAMIHRSKAELHHRYGLGVNAATGIIEPNGFEIHDEEFQANILRLLNESMMHAATAVADAAINFDGAFNSQHLDDHQDYLNACLDQLDCIRTILHEDDGDKIAELTLTLINATEAQLELRSDGGYPDLGFLYGYADHYSPISELAAMNIDNDDLLHPVHGD